MTKKKQAGGAVKVAHIVSRAADKAMADYIDALERRDWHVALEQLCTNLVWRSAALALHLRMTSPTALLAGDAIAIVAAVGRDCFNATRHLGPSDEPDSLYQKAGYIQHVLLSVAGTIAAIEKAKPHERLQIVTLSALALGRHEGTLAMAEAGHWDTIAAERRRRSNAGKATAKAQREMAEKGWMNAAWKVVGKHQHRDRDLNREGWITLIQSELGNLTPKRTQLGLWLRDEVEAPNGPLRSRARSRSA